MSYANHFYKIYSFYTSISQLTNIENVYFTLKKTSFFYIDAIQILGHCRITYTNTKLYKYM